MEEDLLNLLFLNTSLKVPAEKGLKTKKEKCMYSPS